MKQVNPIERDDSSRGDPLEILSNIRQAAPDGFTQRVMNRLPEMPATPRAVWWPSGWGWAAPALTGSLAALLLVWLLGAPAQIETDPARITVTFELHAPDVNQVEIVGDFTGWQVGQIVLEGPDPTGHWTTRLELPAGRYEYTFLIDGETWMPDPNAVIRRPDGFGHMNSVIHL